MSCFKDVALKPSLSTKRPLSKLGLASALVALFLFKSKKGLFLVVRKYSLTEPCQYRLGREGSLVGSTKSLVEGKQAGKPEIRDQNRTPSAVFGLWFIGLATSRPLDVRV